MDDDGDWITARYVLSTILGRNALVMDYIDEESFPVVDPPPPPATAAGVHPPDAAAEPSSAAVPAPPPVRAPAGVAGMVCSVCTEEIAVADAVVRLPCAHWYHHGCISPWLGIRGTCPLCRAELPPRVAAGDEEGDLAGQAKAAAPAAAAGTRLVAGASARAQQREGGYVYLAGGVLSG
ncbi:hypothetical protein HU200_061301 [Digitaria exilis]|uniref:RING-type domain-containing protein n=1 Tax=Digitaria exilis TaxID=1010633 RepID=A0A835DZK9_9POAL|nr:hypothetical protein HU200_061301 [Digitaria exilis]CAB3456399.1 unnamed protein product [Digitaria exilis]